MKFPDFPIRTLPAAMASAAALTAGIILLSARDDGIAHGSETAPPPAARLLAVLSSGDSPALAEMAMLGDDVVRHASAPQGRSFMTSAGGGGPEAIARRFLAEHAGAFGLPAGGGDFILTRLRAAGSWHYVKLQQSRGGLPVYCSQAIIQVGENGGVEYIGNYLARDLERLPQTPVPVISAAEAREAARSHFYAESKGIDVAVSDPELVWFAPSLLTLPGPPQLAWQSGVRSANPVDVNVLAFVSATTGEVLHQVTFTCAALHRTVFDGENDSQWPRQPGFPFPPYVPPPDRVEFGPSASLSDVNQIFDGMGETFNFYKNKHGRDGIGNSGKPMFGVARRCATSGACPMPNAYWSGLPVASFPGIPGFSIDEGNINFGDGWAKDDVVAHEYTHGVTQYESGLIYQNAPGAMNEAFSDIWGEFVDLGNGRGNDNPNVRWDVGEDLGGGRLRSMSDPPAEGDPDRLGSPMWWTPASSPTQSNDQGGVHVNSGVINKLCFLLTDGGSFNGYTISGMGVDRIAPLFYEANANLLGSTADYTDLSASLFQAAANLGWNAGDIANLRKAALAVEIVNNWVDRANSNGAPNGCRRPGVGTGGPFRTVAPAVASLRSGDPVNIRAGTYDEAIRITKPMRLTSWGGTATIGR